MRLISAVQPFIGPQNAASYKRFCHVVRHPTAVDGSPNLEYQLPHPPHGKATHPSAASGVPNSITAKSPACFREPNRFPVTYLAEQIGTCAAASHGVIPKGEVLERTRCVRKVVNSQRNRFPSSSMPIATMPAASNRAVVGSGVTTVAYKCSSSPAPIPPGPATNTFPVPGTS